MFRAIKYNLEMAHVVPNGDKQEQNIHGHTWKLEVTFEGNDLNYTTLNSFVNDYIVSFYNYSLCLQKGVYPKKFIRKAFEFWGSKILFFNLPPTCEIILQDWYDILTKQILWETETLRVKPNFKIVKVKLWEGGCSYAKIK